jgi:hypothetical protein
MYYWDQPDQAALKGARRRHPGRPASRAAHAWAAGAAGPVGPAAQAVQVALDRRDNGGDSGAARDQ